jgi:ion channel-forming bestrophin family protein
MTLKLFWQQKNWLRSALKLRGSVLSAVYPRALLCGIFGVIISWLYSLGLPVALPILAGVIPNIVLGLMLVFRTNTAYERFWEGRKLWGNLINAVRNLARNILVSIREKDPQDQADKMATLHLIVAFAVATKLHLRHEPINSELERLLSPSHYSTLKTMNNPPLAIAVWIQDYLQQQFHRGCLDGFQLNTILATLNTMVDSLGGCERILKTPIPLAYAIHLKQLLLIYCLTLPFQFVQELQWLTGAIVALISFTLFGIEEIGLEIENPFGHDANDLPLDSFCETMQRNINDIMTLEPVSRRDLREI